MSNEYEEARVAFEEHGEQARLAHQSRESLKTWLILLATWAVGALVLVWIFGMPH